MQPSQAMPVGLEACIESSSGCAGIEATSKERLQDTMDCDTIQSKPQGKPNGSKVKPYT